MDENNASTDRVIAELINMGFEFDQAAKAANAVGPCLEDAVEFILNGSFSGDTVHNEQSSVPFRSSTSRSYSSSQLISSPVPSRRVKQSCISDLFSSSGKSRSNIHSRVSDFTFNGKESYKSGHFDEVGVSNANTNVKHEPISESSQQNSHDRVRNTNTNVKLEPVSESSQQNSHDRVRNTCTNVKLEPISESSQQSSHDRVRNTNTYVKLEPVSESSHLNSHDQGHCIESNVASQERGTIKSQKNSSSCSSQIKESNMDWEEKVRGILRRYFGISTLKGFQKEALEAWLAHRDCLVLAATGSGKSLCFQIPALLTGKVVVVISPLISLMHDQCLKLASHGISACFLGSGQPDRTVECKAMSGMYRIIYVCPETVLRLMEPLKDLAESRGIALFAIDEVHCVSKWGHDFRPDYRRLSILRENFSACKLNFLEFDIPLMSLTATATVPVREDILRSLRMSMDTKIVLTTFFRPNLRFSVKHSRTSSPSSYDDDFHELIQIYAISRGQKRKAPANLLRPVNDNCHSSFKNPNDSFSDAEEAMTLDSSGSEDGYSDQDDADAGMENANSTSPSEEYQLTAEYLEDEVDLHHGVDDLDVSFGDFSGSLPPGSSEFHGASERPDVQDALPQGPTIIYVPTRKETTKISEYLSRFGVRAAAYHAKLPKPHLRRVHHEFHQNTLEVVVATIAFGMGIDKSNVRRIIHYGWPQSLEAYYQEAGRAGRDGKLSDCTLYANLSRIPTLLPNQRSEEQTKQAYKMLSDCFRYGMSSATCRAKTLVKYFGEEFIYDKCQICDVCVNGPPKLQNLMEEATIFMHVLKAQSGNEVSEHVSDGGAIQSEYSTKRRERGNFKMIVSRIREQFQKFSVSDQLWWRGLARILEDKGLITEGNYMARVSISCPELTELGLRFLRTECEQTLYAYPEADMLLATQRKKPYSRFSEWGKGWADPEIRRQRLQGRKWRTPRKRNKKPRRQRQVMSTVRGRLSAKLSKQKR